MRESQYRPPVLRREPASSSGRAPIRGTSWVTVPAPMKRAAVNGRYATPVLIAEYPQTVCMKTVRKKNIPKMKMPTPA